MTDRVAEGMHEHFDRVVKETWERIAPKIRELEREQLERQRRFWDLWLKPGPVRHSLQQSFERRGA